MGTKYSDGYADEVAAAFTDERSGAFAEKYLDELVANWRGMIQRAGRVAWLMVFLIALYFVLGSGTVAEVGLVGVKLDEEGLEVVAKFLPPVVAFLWADLWLLGRSTDVFEAIHRRLIGIRLGEQVSDAVIEPIRPTGVLMGFSGILSSWAVPGHGRANERLVWTGAVNHFAAFYGSAAFLLYGYVTLFAEYGVADPLVWVGLVVTVTNVIRVIAIWHID